MSLMLLWRHDPTRQLLVYSCSDTVAITHFVLHKDKRKMTLPMMGEIVLDSIQVLARALTNTVSHFFPATTAITIQESLSILNIKENDPVLARNAFEMHYDKNAPSKGGSPYIQSRILNAFQKLCESFNAQQ